MNARILAAAALAIGACSDDTGILVEVQGDQLQIRVDRLETMVYLDEVGDDPGPSDRDWGAAQRIETTIPADVNLALDPHELMLRPEGVSGTSRVWVSALAYDGDGNLIGWGGRGPIQFEPGLVKKVHFDLVPARFVGEGCIVEGDTVVVRNDEDCDDDGFTKDTDCDDLDELIGGDTDGDPVVCDPDCDQESGAVYPGNHESCDGIDNDCDPLTGPPPEVCATVVREGDQVVECDLGQRVCADLGPDPTYGPCVASPIDVASNAELCEVWAACQESGQTDCFVDGQIRCKLPRDAEAGDLCVPANHALQPFVDLTECTWRLVGNTQQGAWNVGLRPRDTNDLPGTLVDTCDAEIVVGAADNLPRVFVVEASNAVESITFAIVIAPSRSDCDSTSPEVTPMECEPLSP